MLFGVDSHESSSTCRRMLAFFTHREARNAPGALTNELPRMASYACIYTWAENPMRNDSPGVKYKRFGAMCNASYMGAPASIFQSSLLILSSNLLRRADISLLSCSKLRFFFFFYKCSEHRAYKISCIITSSVVLTLL
jgi:hypothetical protein